MTSDKVFRRKVEDRYPHIAVELLSRPVLENPSVIGKIYEMFCNVVELPERAKVSEKVDFMVLFIALVLKCFDPDYVSGYKVKVRDGVRPQLARILGKDQTYISNLFTMAVSRMVIYRSFAENVDNIFEKIEQELTVL